jgi:tetratricopeptide (TPR) repeat protein
VSDIADRAFCDGLLAQIAGDLAAAERAYRLALSARPAHPGVHHHLALVLLGDGRSAEALAVADDGLQSFASAAPLWLVRGNALTSLGQPAAACAALEQAVALDPGDAASRTALGTAYITLNREADSVICLEAGAPDPDHHYLLGVALAKLGRLDEAVAHLDQAIAARPDVPRYYMARARFGLTEAHVAGLDAISADQLTVADRIDLYFARGRAYDMIGRYEAAFAAWQQGNALYRQGLAYDEAANLRLLDRLRHSRIRDRRFGSGSVRPIFIVGMPRSGSTLIEQILASHPMIYGAGEIDDFGTVLAHILDEMLGDPIDHLVDPSDDLLVRIGPLYEKQLRELHPTAPCITDKTLGNFRFLGLIAEALPHARIIHARRDPLDCCFSSFAERFVAGQEFTFDLAELGRCYAAYRRLMAHWCDILPTGVMIEIDYEALVTDPETEARRMLDHVGLDWDPACLAFEQNPRPVRTASVVQVRRKIYRGAVGRATPYRPFLQTLRDALGE